MFQRSLLLVLCLSLMVAAQTTKSSKPAASGAAHPASAPEAIFHTSVGDLKCQLFPDKAPKTVENFIGLSTGKKDWTNPRDNKPMHGFVIARIGPILLACAESNKVFHRLGRLVGKELAFKVANRGVEYGFRRGGGGCGT